MARERSATTVTQSFQSDSILFHGSKLPGEVRKMVPLLSSLKMEKFKKLMQAVCSSIENTDFDPEHLQSLVDKSLPEDSVNQLFSGIYTILKAAFRQPLTSMKPEAFKAELLTYKIPNEFIDEITKTVFGKSRTDIEKSLLGKRIRLPRLERLNWRVDVAISTSSLNRVLVPSVLMEIKSSDGNIKSFEVSLQKFNELEYDVAYILKEMEDLEKRSILKIQD